MGVESGEASDVLAGRVSARPRDSTMAEVFSGVSRSHDAL